jgi:radical SAM protein with 4Fe4S-binding SPASM domain
MHQFVLREERGSSGYLFDRSTGKVTHVRPERLDEHRHRRDVEFLELREDTPRYARSVPFCIWLELTVRCNLQCIHCSVDAQARTDVGELGLRQVEEMLQQFVDFGIFEIRLSGGEPTCHPDYARIVKAAHEKGLFVSVSTNGVWPKGRRKEFARLPVGLHIVSLDGTKEEHNALRPPGDTWSKAVETIRCLVEEGRRVRVNTVLNRRNSGHLREHVAHLVALGVEALTLVPVRPTGRAGTPEMFGDLCLSTDEYQQVLDEVQGLREEFDFEIATSYDLMAKGKMFNTPAYFSKRCVAGSEAACVGPTGQLRSCILLDDDKYVVGDLVEGEASLSKLWNDDARWGMFRSESSVPDCCKECKHLGKDCFGVCHVYRESPLSPDLPFCPIKES